jgi:hypothetical protein
MNNRASLDQQDLYQRNQVASPSSQTADFYRHKIRKTITVLILLFLLVIVILAGGFYWFCLRQDYCGIATCQVNPEELSLQINSNQQAGSPSTEEKSLNQIMQEENYKAGVLDKDDSWLVYQNQDYGISFQYPADWKILEISGSSEVLPLYNTKLYFMKAMKDEHVFTPSRFAVELFKNEKEIKNQADFKNFLQVEYRNYFDALEDLDSEFNSVRDVKLGNKTATALDVGGMLTDSYSAVWITDDRAIFVGSIGLTTYPYWQEPFEEIGETPYEPNQATINKILKSFVIEESYSQGLNN